MIDIKPHFTTHNRSFLFLLVICLMLIICVLVLISPLHRFFSEGHNNNSPYNCRLSDFGFLYLLSEKDEETLLLQYRIICDASSAIMVAKREEIESFEHIIDDERLREALDLSKKLISTINTRIILCNFHVFRLYSNQITSTCRKCILTRYKCFNETTRLNNRQFGSICSVLHNILVIYDAQSDIDSMLQILLLLESICNSVQLDSFFACKRILGGYESIVHFSCRIFDVLPMESQLILTEMLERVQLRLNLLVYGLVYTARNETLLASPLLQNKEHFDEAIQLVFYYSNIIENMPVFFELEGGPIYNFDVSEIDFGDDSLISRVRFMKTDVQWYRDHYASLFCRIRFLLSRSVKEE